MKLRLALLLSTCALAACADEMRREYVYKPAYCLASGLAGVKGGDECLPEMLKEKAVAVADAKLKNAVAPVPSQQFAVYYTADQRAGIGYDIARIFFAPDDSVTTQSVTMSLEAAKIIEPKSATSKKCGAREARADLISNVADTISDSDINRDTASFLGEHYTDLQLTELYRVAKEGGSMADVKDDAFILPDPKDKTKSINVKPKNDRKLGGILSFTTSRVASNLVKQHHAEIIAKRDEVAMVRQNEACPAPTPVAQPVIEEEIPAATDTPLEQAPELKKEGVSE